MNTQHGLEAFAEQGDPRVKIRSVPPQWIGSLLEHLRLGGLIVHVEEIGVFVPDPAPNRTILFPPGTSATAVQRLLDRWTAPPL